MTSSVGRAFTTGRLTEWFTAPREARERALQSCLDRIRDLDPSIQAWAQVQPQRPAGDGPIGGVPFGAKDIIETRGLVTQYGSPLYKGRIGTEDAGIVRELRQRGAILMGKTQTTAFAYRTPAPTRNPRNLQHTPGGSSSGSAAAVAAGMVPLAIGTQTQGSVLRPASYCGVTGFKPTYGVLPMDGVLPLATSLDTLGFFTETPADMLAFWDAIGFDVGQTEAFDLGMPDPVPDVEAPMASAFQDAVLRLRRAGLTIRPVDLGDILAKLNDASGIVMAYEAVRSHEQRYREHGSNLGDLADLIREGQVISEHRYRDATQYIEACRMRIAELYKATPVMLAPAATGPAPFGLASTGDARMNAPWTALGTPAISIPMGTFNGLPLGLQLTANRGEDVRLLRSAARLEAVLNDGLWETHARI